MIMLYTLHYHKAIEHEKSIIRIKHQTAYIIFTKMSLS